MIDLLANYEYYSYIYLTKHNDYHEMTKISKSHQAADAMDWNEAMMLVQKMYDDGMVRDSLLIDTGGTIA